MPRIIALIGLLTFAIGLHAWADVIELTTGQRIEGTLQQASRDGVVVEVGGQVVRFDPARVRAIYFGTAPPVTAATASAPGSEAVRALKDFGAALQVGVNLSEFQRRLADVNARVQQYSEHSSANSELRQHLSAAVVLYKFAGEAWGASLMKYETLQVPKNSAALQLCPQAGVYVRSHDEAAKFRDFGAHVIQGRTACASLAEMTQMCAAERVTAAEQQLTTTR